MRPLAGEVLEVGDVLLPGLYGHGMFAGGGEVPLVEVLVRQPAEAVAELVDDDGQVPLVVRRAQQVGVVHPAPAVDFAIGEDNEVLVRDADQGVVDGLDLACRQVAVGVEGVEVRRERRARPALLPGDGDARFLGGGEDGYDVEVLAVALEGLVGEERFGSGFGVLEEGIHLACLVPFGQDR